jgi:hypothetical protein
MNSLNIAIYEESFKCKHVAQRMIFITHYVELFAGKF